MREVKFVRFPGRYALQSPVSEKPSENGGLFPGQVKRTGNSLSENIRKGFGRGLDGIKSITRLVRPDPLKDSSTDLDARRKVFDPQGIFLQRWNKIFVLSCIFAISVDPLFFYIPFINSQHKCLDLDHRLEIIASVLRFFTDAFYILHIFFQFNTGFIAPSSRVFGRGILVEDYKQIALRYLSTYFLIDILAVLPLPQVFILIIVPKLKGPHSLREKNILRFLIIVQYIPRIWRIIPLYKEVRRTSGIITETAWLGAALNLFLYMLASHIIGAFWYLLAIERQDTCWRKSCNTDDVCLHSLYCLKGDSSNLARNKTILDSGCPINPTDNQKFNFGMYLSALDSGIVNSTDFPEKFFYCFWWGLQNLSSLGQNLKTSTYVWEIAFAVFISISGLVLFSLLIGNMQTYLQSTTLRLEEMRVKRRDAEQWMSHRLLPENLRERIRRYEQYRWQETRGVNEDILLRNLPKDLRRDIKRHLCLSLLMKVPLFEKMDEQLLDAMCDRLVTTLFTEGSYVVREGDPVDEMLFIIRGKLESATTNGGRTGFLNSDLLIANNFCGDELLTWALVPQSTSNLPISTRTVKALTEVEAFALKADDLKFVATQFRRLHSKQLRHTFRFYSPQWKTWAAGFIQAAWRRYVRKKMDDALHVEEEKLQSSLVKDATFSTSLGVTIYASRFASNALKLIKHGGARRARVPERMPPIMLPKPEEPDFSVIDGN